MSRHLSRSGSQGDNCRYRRDPAVAIPPARAHSKCLTQYEPHNGNQAAQAKILQKVHTLVALGCMERENRLDTLGMLQTELKCGCNASMIHCND